MLLFRAMKETLDGLPEVGSSTRMLGVRFGIDIPAKNPTEIVRPGQGGMSVSPNDPTNLRYFRRPPEFGGTGKDPIWIIVDNDLAPNLQYRPDPDTPNTHGFIEPSRLMTLQDYQDALENTQGYWKKY